MEDAASLILPNCRPTASQEEKLRSCPFARESEVFSADEALEQSTGLMAVSMPESSGDSQTPPEHQLSSQNSSNDGQVPAEKTATLEQETESGRVRDEEMMVVDDDTVFEDNNKVMVGTKQMEEEHTVEENNTQNLLAKMLKNTAALKVFAEMPMREQEASMSTNNYVDPKGIRTLPVSFHGTEKKRERFIETMNRALKLLKGEAKAGVSGDEDDRDDDFLETAKRRGMTFPRPRWWPPEGGSED